MKNSITEKTETKKIIERILKKCQAKKTHFAKFILNEKGAFVYQGNYHMTSNEYIAIYYDGTEHHFLGKLNGKNAFEYTKNNESVIKQLVVLVENTKRRRCALAIPSSSLEQEHILEKPVHDLLDTADKGFFLLCTFNKIEDTVNIHIISNTFPDFDIYIVELLGIYEDLKIIFFILFSIFYSESTNSINFISFMQSYLDEEESNEDE